MRDVTKTLVGENKMTTHYLTTKLNQDTIIANIKAELNLLYNVNRTLANQNSECAFDAIRLNWSKMRELEAQLAERENTDIFKEIPSA